MEYSSFDCVYYKLDKSGHIQVDIGVVYSSVMRRPSVHEKDAMSAKDARDEALHVLQMMAAVQDDDDDDTKDLTNSTEQVIQLVYVAFINIGLSAHLKNVKIG